MVLTGEGCALSAACGGPSRGIGWLCAAARRESGDGVAEVAIWSYGLAAVAFLFFALYIFFAWRGALPGGVLFAAVAISGLWAACSAVAAQR